MDRKDKIEAAKQAAELVRRRREEMREQIREDRARGVITPLTVARFAYVHLSNSDGSPLWPAAHHWLWLRLLTNPSAKKLLIKAPPESAKTTWLIAYMACHLGFWPERPIILAAVSGPVAKKRSLALRGVVESADFKKTFPDIEQDKKMPYTAEEWSIAKGGVSDAGRVHPSVMAVGVGGSIIGGRAWIAVADDLLDLDNTRTAHQRNLVSTWIHTSFLSRLMARVGTVRVIGTSWHQNDAYERIAKLGDWVVCNTPILSYDKDDNGNIHYHKEVWADIAYPDDFDGVKLGEPVAGATI